MDFVCLDMEGVLVPEVWKRVASETGLEELALTTRDIADYNELMRLRLAVLEREGIGVEALQSAIVGLQPLPGVLDFLDWLTGRVQFAVVSDTYYEIAMPLMRTMGFPVLFCNRLLVDGNGRISGYQIRQPDQKRSVVRALQSLTYRVLAVGDSYNDIAMLEQADLGVLFCPPDNIADAHPHLPKTDSYQALREALLG